MRLRRITRSPIVFWIAALALAATTGLAVSHLVGSAAAEAAQYGSLQRAVVALHALAPGDVLEAGDVEVRAVPAAFLPADALAAPGLDRGSLAPNQRFDRACHPLTPLRPGHCRCCYEPSISSSSRNSKRLNARLVDATPAAGRAVK